MKQESASLQCDLRERITGLHYPGDQSDVQCPVFSWTTSRIRKLWKAVIDQSESRILECRVIMRMG